MKMIFLSLLISFSVWSEVKKTHKTLPINKDLESLKKEITAKNEKKEDCDDKVKKKVEIKHESISLTGQAGCSLDQHKP